MSWTYTTLKAAIQNYMESDETDFVADIDIIIKQAEDRILKAVQLPDFRKNVTGTTTAANRYLQMPTDFLAPYSLLVDNSGSEFLLFKDVNFVREAYPSAATQGVPKYYAIFDSSYFLLGPTPDSNYTSELHYFYRPQSIVDGSTSWLGTNAEACLLYGCLLEADTYLKGETDMTQKYATRYEEALAQLKLLAEGYSRTDSYRAG